MKLNYYRSSIHLLTHYHLQRRRLPPRRQRPTNEIEWRTRRETEPKHSKLAVGIKVRKNEKRTMEKC